MTLENGLNFFFQWWPMVNIPSSCNLTTEVSYQHIQAESRFDDGKCGYSECVGPLVETLLLSRLWKVKKHSQVIIINYDLMMQGPQVSAFTRHPKNSKGCKQEINRQKFWAIFWCAKKRKTKCPQMRNDPYARVKDGGCGVCIDQIDLNLEVWKPGSHSSYAMLTFWQLWMGACLLDRREGCPESLQVIWQTDHLVDGQHSLRRPWQTSKQHETTTTSVVWSPLFSEPTWC